MGGSVGGAEGRGRVECGGFARETSGLGSETTGVRFGRKLQAQRGFEDQAPGIAAETQSGVGCQIPQPLRKQRTDE